MTELHDESRPPKERQFTVINHEQESKNMSVMLKSGASSTTKKIVNNSLASFKKLAGFDSVLN